jgi:hypothetical protein
MAERNASILRRPLRSAERLRERAICRGSSNVSTPASRSSALLVSVTCRGLLALTHDGIDSVQSTAPYTSKFWVWMKSNAAMRRWPASVVSSSIVAESEVCPAVIQRSGHGRSGRSSK